MKKFCLIIAACLLGACAGFTVQSPAQIAATYCPIIQPELTTLQTSGVFTGGAEDTLTTKITPKVAAVCAAGAVVTSTSLTALASEAVPLITAAISASSLSAADQKTATDIVNGVQLGINAAVGIYSATHPPVATPPAAASSALVA